mgnify:FL=1
MNRPLQPSSRLGWGAFWLGFATFFWGRLLLALLGPLVQGDGSRPIPIPLILGVALEVVLTVAALIAGVLALKRGERSWFNLVGLALALTVGGFWLFIALGEVLLPH